MPGILMHSQCSKEKGRGHGSHWVWQMALYILVSRVLSAVSPHLDWREIVKEEYSRHVLPLLYVSSLEVLCYRVLIAIYGVVPYITVYGWHYLDKGSMNFCLHCSA